MTGMIVPSPQSLINQGFQAFRHGFDSRLVHLKSLKNGGFSGFFYCRYDERYDFFRKRYDWYDKMRQKILKTPENKGFWGFRHGILDLRERRKFEWCPSCKKVVNFIDDYCTNIVTQCSFFMPKFRCKEVVDMLKDEILEKIFMHKDIRTVPIGYQATMINIFTDVLNEIKEGNKYAAVYELLTDTNPFLSTDDGDE